MNKKKIYIYGLLLLLLIIPRITAYFVFGPGIIGEEDAPNRYFPQIEGLLESLSNFFSQTGPLYSLFLLFSQKLFNDIVAGPVFIQHVLGIISALLIFYYFRKINWKLGFIVALFSFSNPISIWVEHTLLRESLVSFFLVLLVILITLAVKEEKYFKIGFGFLTGLLGLTLVFLRIEFLVLVILMPLVLFILKKRKSQKISFKDRIFIKWTLGYFLPFFIIFLVYMSLEKPKLGTTYNSYFNIAYHGSQPELFYYQGSQHPELLRSYQSILEINEGNMSDSMAMLYTATEDYLEEHPKIELSMLEMMDKIYFEAMIKNNLVYQRSFIINMKNHLLGTSELETLVSLPKYEIPGLIGKLFKTYNVFMIKISILLFWFFLPAFIFFFTRWKSLPNEVVISVLIGTVHFLVLSFVADPVHRFRYSLDPFIYFSQIYLIIILIKWLVSKLKPRPFGFGFR